MTEVVLTTGASRCAKLQSNYHHQQSNTRARCASCQLTDSFSEQRESITFDGLAHQIKSKCLYEELKYGVKVYPRPTGHVT